MLAPGSAARSAERHRSWWLREALTEPPGPALTGELRVDVAIIGGGFVGLWTALRLKIGRAHV